jgi:Fe-S-cluster containining protein
MPIIDRIDLQTITEGTQGPPATVQGYPAGEYSPIRRCTGHCCTCFTLGGGLNLADLQALARRDKKIRKGYNYKRPFKSSTGQTFWGSIKDIDVIADMLVPLGLFIIPPGALSKGLETAYDDKPVPYFTCRHFTGNMCTIYAERPHVCSDFPHNRPCIYDSCTREPPGKFIPPIDREVLEEEVCDKIKEEVPTAE